MTNAPPSEDVVMEDAGVVNNDVKVQVLKELRKQGKSKQR